ncbi:MAG TPA: DUF4435 domain-containing protein [Ktedonobacteraceae bacterium]|nr:DUF4435 domain-containing protein [Ktedonobacteraceae bacterium]
MEEGNLSAKAVVRQILLERQYADNEGRVFLIVEGSTDKRVYQWLVAENRCRIIAAQSKENAVKALTILEEEGILGILAIVDADFMVLEEEQPSSPNLLLTDTHDLEMMTINSLALEKVLSEFGSADKIKDLVDKRKKDIRSLLLACAMPIGYLRWVSLRENLSLKFEDLKFEKFINKDDLTIDIMQLIRIVQSHTTGQKDSQKPLLKDSDLHDKIEQLSSDTHDLWHVSCGHDVVTILSFGLRKAIGSSKIAEPDLIEKCLRLAYEHAFFSQTQLYTAIQIWEGVNGTFAVLRDPRTIEGALTDAINRVPTSSSNALRIEGY